MSQTRESLYQRTRTQFTLLLFGGDLISVTMSFLAGYVLRFELLAHVRPVDEFPSLDLYTLHMTVGLAIFAIIAHNQRLYRWSVVVSRARSLTQSFRVAALWAFALVGVALMVGLQPDVSRLFVLCSAVCMFLLVAFWRLLMHAALHKTNFFLGVYKSLALVGTGDNAQRFADSIDKRRAGLHSFAGFIRTSSEHPILGENAGGNVIGQLEELEVLMQSGSFDSVVVCDEKVTNEQLIQIAKLCEKNFVDFKTVPRTFEVFSSCLQIVSMGTLQVMSLSEVPQNRLVNRVIKRTFDVVGATLGLLISLPLYAILIPLVKRESPGPIFYKQTRSGQSGKNFYIFKIRSMRLDAEKNGKIGWSTEVDPRRTRIGTFMRKWNLDEIPQFWNVLRGDMSLVGPRPERPELIANFLEEIPYYQSRHSVKPGMTGWAQVNGLRGDTSIAERIRYDLQYIESWSLWMDLSIQFRTIFNYKGAC